MPKFFVNQKSIKKDIVTIENEDAKHIGIVLRLKEKDIITVCDGMGFDYECEILSLNKENVLAKIVFKYENKAEPKTKITLFQALPKADKMELIIQKCVELGIEEIVPVATENTVVKLDDKKEYKKIQRWQKISESAAKQCKRGKIPQIGSVMTFKEALKKASSSGVAVIPYEKEKNRSLKEFINSFNGETISVFIGPEGGFSEKEIELACSMEALPITFGKRILRTETAGMYAVSILLYELG